MSGQDGQVNLFDHDTWCGKTCQEHSAATAGATSRRSSRRSSASPSRKPPILKCLKRAGQPGGGTTTVWADDGAWLGECMTRNTGESPNAAVESRLSQILEATPQAKYRLSAKACQGILRRAERRGKDLPPRLKAVLLTQSASEADAMGGGKGALVQTEKSGTLGTGNDQTIFCMDTQQGGAELRSDDRAPTLTAAAGMSGNNQPVIAIPINDKATRYAGGGSSRNHDGSGNGLGIGRDGDPSPTITAGDRHIVAAFKAGNGTKANGIGYAEECAPTLGAVSSGSNQVPAVLLDMSHANDVIRECGEIAPSLQARMGTGGNQVPLTYAKQAIGVYKESSQASTCSARDFKDSTDLVVSSEISPALRAKGNDPYREDMAAYVASVDCRNFTEGGEINGTLQAKESGGQSLNLNNCVRARMVVRRLTPLECERLQGYPDGWTDIGEWRDGTGKIHKDADSPRYKACGNSIALPFWDFLAKRISAQYIRPITMGSLFDGIGGFPLVFERHNGKGTARWASEIEEFPIAVTKLRFGEE